MASKLEDLKASYGAAYAAAAATHVDAAYAAVTGAAAYGAAKAAYDAAFFAELKLLQGDK